MNPQSRVNHYTLNDTTALASRQKLNNKLTGMTTPYVIRSKYMCANEFELVNLDITTRKIQVVNLTNKELQDSYEFVTKLIKVINKTLKETKTQNFDVANLLWAQQPIKKIAAEHSSKEYAFITNSISQFLDYSEEIKKDYDSKHKLTIFLTSFRDDLVNFSKEYKKHNITIKATPAFIKFIVGFINYLVLYVRKEMLFKAIANKDNAKVEKLIKKLDSNIEKNGESVLFYALSHGNTEIIYTLIEHGANLNITDHLGRSALTRAVLSGNIDIVNKLIEYGADINVVNVSGDSLLILALVYDQEEIAKKLIENDVDMNIVNKNYQSALEIATAKKFEDVVAMILDKYKAMLQAKARHQLDIDGMLDDYSKTIPPYNQRSQVPVNTRNPIMTAALTGNIPVLEAFIDTNHYDIDAQDENGNTALMMASQANHKDVVNFLISKKADLDVKNNKG